MQRKHLRLIGAIGSMLITACVERPGDESESCSVGVRLLAELGALDDPASVAQPYVADATRAWFGWVSLEAGTGQLPLAYAENGRFIGVLGRRGGGPEELANPVRITLDSADSIWVSEARGRVVVFAPDGTPVRTIVNPSVYPIDGFTPSGLPYSTLVKVVPDVAMHGYVQVWTRDGDASFAVGPGAAETAEGAVQWSPLIPPKTRITAVGDTIYYAPGGWNTWLLKWISANSEPVLSGAAVWSALGLGEGPASAADGLPIAAMHDGREGVWLVGAVRRVSQEDERGIRERVASAAGASSGSFAVRFSAAVRNEVFDGVLLHVNADGQVTGATTFDEHPWGFASSDAYYTFAEAETGLIQTRIWQFTRTCH